MNITHTKDVLIIEYKKPTFGLTTKDVASFLVAQSMSYDVWSGLENPAQYQHLIVFGSPNTSKFLSPHQSICYIIDADIDSNVLLKDIKNELSRVEQALLADNPNAKTISVIQKSRSNSEVFSFFQNKVSVQSPVFEAALITDIFDCSKIETFIKGNERLMILYCGTAPIEAENAFKELSHKFHEIALSTLTTPFHFSHATLAQNVIVDIQSLNLELCYSIFRDLNFRYFELTNEFHA